MISDPVYDPVTALEMPAAPVPATRFGDFGLAGMIELIRANETVGRAVLWLPIDRAQFTRTLPTADLQVPLPRMVSPAEVTANILAGQVRGVPGE